MNMIFTRNFLMVLFVSLTLVSCKSPTTKPQGDGANIDTESDVDGTVVNENMTQSDGTGAPEPTRFPIKDGVEYGRWGVVLFDYDSTTVRSSERDVLDQVATWAKENPGKKILVAGHCDERGTLEYNRALGQRRASAAREYLIKQGVPASNVGTVSYGEEQPSDTGHDEGAWTKNRRAEFGVVK
jgi:peptidoglycan-associated lipoprotein